jgi:hypothetical protein
MIATERHPIRRVMALLAAGMLALTGAGVLVLATAQSASAADLTITSPSGFPVIYESTLPVTGTANPGDTVTVSAGLAGVSDCVVVLPFPGDGTWQCDLTNLPNTNSFNISVSRTPLESLDNASIPIRGVLLPPVVTSPAPGNTLFTNAASPTIEGNFATASGETVTVHIDYGDGNVCDSSDSDYITGDWTCSVALPEGTYNSVAVTQTVHYGAATPTSTATFIDVVVDRTALDPSIETPISSEGYAYSSDTTPVIGGTAESLANVTVLYHQGMGSGAYTPFCSATADFFGSYSCSSGLSPLTPGEIYTFGATQTDRAGNSSPGAAEILYYQVNYPPQAPEFSTPTGGYSAVNPYVYFSGTQSGPQWPITLLVNDQYECTPSVVPGEGEGASSWSCSGGPYAPGNYIAQVYTVDGDGTPSASSFRAFTIEAPFVAPTLPVATPTPTPTPTATVPPIDVTITITDKDGNDLTGKPVKAGQTIVVNGSGAPAGSTVDIELHSDPITLGTTNAKPDGTFSLTSVVPRTVEPGAHHFVVTVTPAGQTPAVFETAATIEAADPDEVAQAKATEQPDKSDVIAYLNSLAGGGGGGFDSPSSFSSTLQTAGELRLTPAMIGATGLIASAFLLLVAFPAELLEVTIRENYGRVFGWTAPIKRRLARIKAAVKAIPVNTWVATLGIIGLTALILGFSDPGFGFNGSSVRLWIALVVSIVLLNIVVSSIVMSVAKRRFTVDSTLEPMPAALLLVALSVIVSRLVGIQPGFLFGVVLGVAFAVELRKKQSAQLVMLGIGLSVVIGIGAWFGYSALATNGAEPGFWQLLLQETLAATTVEALATMTIALLPLEFLDGKTIFEWNRWAWAGTYAVALVTFIVVILPLSGNWGQMSAPLLGWGAFFAGFAVLAVGIWAFFRFVRPRVTTAV